MTASARGSRLLPRQSRFTGRAGMLAVVVCVVALSLAYPVREYLAQRQQIGRLAAGRQSLSNQVRTLQTEQRKLADPTYVEQQAEDRLGMCLPGKKCYVVVGGSSSGGPRQLAAAATPWYSKLWQSVAEADGTSPR